MFTQLCTAHEVASLSGPLQGYLPSKSSEAGGRDGDADQCPVDIQAAAVSAHHKMGSTAVAVDRCDAIIPSFIPSFPIVALPYVAILMVF